MKAPLAIVLYAEPELPAFWGMTLRNHTSQRIPELPVILKPSGFKAPLTASLTSVLVQAPMVSTLCPATAPGNKLPRQNKGKNNSHPRFIRMLLVIEIRRVAE